MSYKESINKLLSEKIIVTKDNLEVSFWCNGKALLDSFPVIEENLNTQLPLSYKQFLLEFNGLELFRFEDIGGIVFFSTENIVAENIDFRQCYDETEWRNSFIVIGRIVGDGDYIGMQVYENGEYEIIDCYHEHMPKDWDKINSSIDEFLISIIQNEGEKYWLRSV